MGDGLKRVAKQCGGPTVVAGGATARYDANGSRIYGEPQYYCTDCQSALRDRDLHNGRCGCGSGRVIDLCKSTS